MSNSSEHGNAAGRPGHVNELAADLLHGIARETAGLGGEIAALGETLCKPATEVSPQERIVWMQSFDRLEQAARALGRVAAWLADCQAAARAPAAAEVAAALETIPLLDMKDRLARVAGIVILAAADDDDWDDLWGSEEAQGPGVRYG